jgi:predicted nuclease with TOPRIM domain
LSLWHDFENLQRKKTELEDQLVSLEERSKLLEQKLKSQEERVQMLEEQLRNRNGSVDRLESTVLELEKKLRKPEKEPEIPIPLSK